MTPITDNAELAAFCKRIASAPFIAVDTEFMRETTYWPKLCLIQVASETDAAISIRCAISTCRRSWPSSPIPR